MRGFSGPSLAGQPDRAPHAVGHRVLLREAHSCERAQASGNESVAHDARGAIASVEVARFICKSAAQLDHAAGGERKRNGGG